MQKHRNEKDEMNETSLNERLLAWMKGKNPEDWHKVVCTYNWDNGMAPLLWLAEQAALDRATAHTLFWLTAPDYFLLGKLYRDGGRDLWEAGERKLCLTLFERIQAGSISNSAFQTQHSNTFAAETWERFARSEGANPDEFVLPEWMHEPVSGMAVDTSDMDEGYPKEFFST